MDFYLRYVFLLVMLFISVDTDRNVNMIKLVMQLGECEQMHAFPKAVNTVLIAVVINLSGGDLSNSLFSRAFV